MTIASGPGGGVGSAKAEPGRRLSHWRRWDWDRFAVGGRRAGCNRSRLRPELQSLGGPEHPRVTGVRFDRANCNPQRLQRRGARVWNALFGRSGREPRECNPQRLHLPDRTAPPSAPRAEITARPVTLARGANPATPGGCSRLVGPILGTTGVPTLGPTSRPAPAGAATIAIPPPPTSPDPERAPPSPPPRPQTPTRSPFHRRQRPSRRRSRQVPPPRTKSRSRSSSAGLTNAAEGRVAGGGRPPLGSCGRSAPRNM